MDKKNKGLADDQQGDFILNETGTSVNNSWDAGNSNASNRTPEQSTNDSQNENQETPNTSPLDSPEETVSPTKE